MLSYEGLKAAFEAKPACSPETPFGPEPLVFKVGGKMFGLLSETTSGPSISLKCEPALGEIMRETWAAITAGYHLNKRHWITVTQDADLPDEEILKLIDHSYDLVVGALPKRMREEISNRS